VIRGNDIEGAVAQRGDERLAVRLGSQRRIHFEIRVVLREQIVGEGEVMGRGLGGDPGAAGLGPADDIDGEFRRNVLQVNVGARVFRKDHVARHESSLRRRWASRGAQARRDDALVHHRALRHRLILAVIHHRQIEHLGVLRGAAHEIVRLHAIAVIRDRHDPARFSEPIGASAWPFCPTVMQPVDRRAPRRRAR